MMHIQTERLPDMEILSESASPTGWLCDEPISDPRQDRLGFDVFAQTLTDFIRDPASRTPLTIGVYGKWGSGKTSLMRLIHSKLTCNSSGRPGFETECLWFNAWEHYNEQGALASLLRALGERLEGRTGEGGINSGENTRGIAGAVAERLRGDVVAGGPALNNDVPLSPCNYEPIRDRFSALVQQVVGGKGRLVVFVDDLDRCLPERVVAVLEDIKLILHVPRCVFVIGADRELIHRSVRIVYQSLQIPDVSLGETERDYLEKIVQVEFSLPPVSWENLNRYVDALDGGDTLKACAHFVLEGVGENPRQLKRFVNEYRLLSTLATRSGLANHDKSQINLELLAKWLTLTRRWEMLAEDIRKHPTLLPHLEAAATTSDETQRDSLFRSSPLAARYLDEERLLSLLELPPYFADVDLKPYIHLTHSAEGEQGHSVQQARSMRHQELLAELFCQDAVRCETALAKVSSMAPVRRRGLVEPAIERLAQGESWQRVIAADLLGAIGEEEALEGLNLALEEIHTAEAAPRDLSGDDFQLKWALLHAIAQYRSEWARSILSDHGLVTIPAGEFAYGERIATPDSEISVRSVHLDEFCMERYPVTNGDYARFVRAAGHRPPRWWQGNEPPERKANHPVTGVTLEDAKAYARWARRRLPTEQEWEKAARGADGRLFPWGNVHDPNRCNVKESYRGDTTPVDQFPEGVSPYGCWDMIGNVWELTATAFGEDARDRAGNPDEFSSYPILRGGSYDTDQRMARCSGRIEHSPVYRISLVGFRCCLSSATSKGRSH